MSKQDLKYLIRHHSIMDCKDCGFECNNSAMFCLCMCPYCGMNEKNCICTQSFTYEENLFPRKNICDNPIDIVRESSIERHICKSWWRLEKWHIGRSKFP